jgi:putative ABC transport system ATP-binding protein
MDAGPVVELQGVNKVYGDGVPTPVLFDIDLAVARSEFVSIVGASGSGKTTLLNLMGLLDMPTSGRILLSGQDTARLDEDARARLRLQYLGFIFQFHYLLPQFSVLENVLIPRRIMGREAERERRERAVELLDRVGLGNRLHYRPGQISGGQQQRVAVVRAFINEPALVLADEPTGNLDSTSGAEVLSFMRSAVDDYGQTVVMVTHDPVAASYAHQVIFLVDGRVVGDLQQPTAESVLDRMKGLGN